MKFKTAVSALLALSLSTSGIALAQEGGHRDDMRRSQQDQRDDRHDGPGARPQGPSHGNDNGQGHGNGNGNAKGNSNSRHDSRGAGPNHAYHRGDRLPPQFHQRRYVVTDWRGHHLSAPPRGYHWVRTGDDFVLVAIATGVILQLLLSH
jgi:Ni/Co efflux regulator RcnB